MRLTPLEPSTLHASANNVNCISYPPEHQAPTSPSSSTDDSIASLETEPDKMPPLTLINEANSHDAYTLDTSTILASLSDAAIMSSEAFHSTIVQKPNSLKISTTATLDSPPDLSHVPPNFLPSLPHIPANVPMPLDPPINSRTCNMGHHETGHPDSHTVIEGLSILATELFRLTKDGTLLLQVHRCMQMVDQEHINFKTLQTQLFVIKRVLLATDNLLAAIQSESNHSDSQPNTASQRWQNLHSICLGAEASIAVISGFLTRAGHPFSADSSIPCVA